MFGPRSCSLTYSQCSGHNLNLSFLFLLVIHDFFQFAGFVLTTFRAY
jgi:hypothetical protein